MAFYKTKDKTALSRLNTRIFSHQSDFIKKEVKKSKGTLTDGDVIREMLDEAITNRKQK